MNTEPFLRRITSRVEVGKIPVGGGTPVSIQSMLNVRTADVSAALEQIRRLAAAGCDIVRLAVRDSADADAIAEIREKADIPLVADIHFDHRLALLAAKAGVDKLRINPGNIGSSQKVKEVARAASERKIPIRVGVNAGSLPRDIANSDILEPEKMVAAAERELSVLEDAGFSAIVISLKSHRADSVIEANRIFSAKYQYPLHLGVTEAGLPGAGSIRSAVGIGTLLMEGIGDTVRVSLTGDPVREVSAAREILRACGLRKSGIELVSCPGCGRCRVNLESVAAQVEKKLPETDIPLTVAVMGCEVNGPGEAKSADIGIAGGDGFFLLFEKGDPRGRISEDNAVDRLIDEVEKLISESR